SFAWAVATLGDVTGDGVPDYVVGNTFDDTLGPKTGSAWVYSGADLSLLMLTHELSIEQGGVQDLGLVAGPQHAGASYLLLGSLTGTTPGFDVHGVHVPLVPDAWFDLSYAFPNNGVLVNSLGTLDASGNALAAFSLPAGLVPTSAAGLVFHHAYVVFEPGAGVQFASNALPLTLLP
ncbi:MAG: hypothetical protein H6825_14985, partial [Planctomycetes bacterium]|nr:hypothetical protein [Planctomycetota bacterium]